MLILKRQLIENFIIQRMNRQYNHIIYQINSNNIKQEQYDDIIDIVIFLIEKKHKSKYIVDVINDIAYDGSPSTLIDCLKQAYITNIDENDIKTSYDVLREIQS